MAEYAPETLTSWLNAKGFEFVCPICGSKEYVPSEHPIRIFAPGSGLSSWEESFRGVYIYCEDCGYTMFFNLEKIPLEED